jgi:hypothetical protein
MVSDFRQELMKSFARHLCSHFYLLKLTRTGRHPACVLKTISDGNNHRNAN